MPAATRQVIAPAISRKCAGMRVYTGTGLLARAFCHEDHCHLDGILYLNRMIEKKYSTTRKNDDMSLRDCFHGHARVRGANLRAVVRAVMKSWAWCASRPPTRPLGQARTVRRSRRRRWSWGLTCFSSSAFAGRRGLDALRAEARPVRDRGDTQQ